jgi:hypothetical protein
LALSFSQRRGRSRKTWHAQRFYNGTFLTTHGERAKLQELKLSLAE